jgi:glycerol-3-phosphate dehydrogenase (NAD(P)+)
MKWPGRIEKVYERTGMVTDPQVTSESAYASAKTGLPIAVLGAGSWGTALAILAARRGHDVRFWTRQQSHAATMESERQNQRYLPGHTFPAKLIVTDDIAQAVAGAKIVVIAVPSHGLRGLARMLSNLVLTLANDAIFLIATKGIEVDSLLTMDRLLEQELPPGTWTTAVLGGPSFAAEVAAGLPTAVVVASQTQAARTTVQVAFSGGPFRVYVSDDVVGVEVGGAFKNVVALAAGINDGAGYGQNARAALITRGLAETQRLALAMGAKSTTLAGLAGVGDLILTCTGGLSRNRKVGIELGRGRAVDEILEEMQRSGMVAEGVRNAKSVHQLAMREGVDMPIVEAMHAILYENRSVGAAVRGLMERDLKAET